MVHKEGDAIESFRNIPHAHSLSQHSSGSKADEGMLSASSGQEPNLGSVMESNTSATTFSDASGSSNSIHQDPSGTESRDDGSGASSSGSPSFQLRKDATTFVAQTLQRGCKNLWQLTTSHVSVLLSSATVCSTSIHQFLKNYEDCNIFVLVGEAFLRAEANEFRQKVKVVCKGYYIAFHRQNISVSWNSKPTFILMISSSLMYYSSLSAKNK